MVWDNQLFLLTAFALFRFLLISQSHLELRMLNTFNKYFNIITGVRKG